MLQQISDFFITRADAADASAAQSGGGVSLIVMTGIFVFFMYFMVWRPQNKRMKDQRNLIQSIEKGDELVTSGGLLGKVVAMHDQYIVLSLANNVDVTLQKSAIASAVPKGTLKSLS